MMGWQVMNPVIYKIFSGKNCIRSPCFLFMTEWFSLNTSGITSVCLRVCSDWFVYWLYIAISSSTSCYWQTLLLSHGAPINFPFWIHFLFFFSSKVFIFNLISLSFDSWIFCHLLKACFRVSGCFLCFFDAVNAGYHEYPKAYEFSCATRFYANFFSVSIKWVWSWSHASWVPHD